VCRTRRARRWSANIAALESGRHGIAFASGMAAIGAIMQRLSAGDHVIYEENVYGGTHRFFDKVMRRLGVDFTAVDSSDPQRVRTRSGRARGSSTWRRRRIR
jgi:cystathionine beta-lyase/cystathionine gamma-synthase